MQGGSRAGALWCHRGCATGASCCCLPPPPSKLSTAFHLAATEGSLHEGRGRSSVGQPAATDHKQRRRRPVGTSGNQRRANRHTGAAPHQCRGVVLRGCDVRREAVACVRCLCLLGVSRLGSGKAKCRLSCVRPSGAQPSGQQGSAACDRATGSGQRTPASCAAPTHRWQVRAEPRHHRPASPVAACINATAAASMFSKLQCCCRCSRAGRAGWAGEASLPGRGATTTTWALPPLCSCRSQLACPHPLSHHPPGVQMCGCCWYRPPT